jgi:hypothetical protein
MIDGFDTNPAFVLSRSTLEKQELYNSLVQTDAIDKIMLWFSSRGRTLTQAEAWAFIPMAISMSQNSLYETHPSIPSSSTSSDASV